MTSPKTRQTPRIQNVTVVRKPKPRLNVASVPPKVPLNPAMPMPTRLKLKSAKVPAPVPGKLPESVQVETPAPAPEPVPTPAPASPSALALKAPPPDPQARQAKAEWWAKQAALRARLRDLSPKLFGDGPPLPLMRGIDRALRERLGLAGDEDLRLLKVAMRTHVRRRAYLLALSADGAMRHGLNGEPVEEVSAEHRNGARAWLAKLAEQQARKAPARKQEAAAAASMTGGTTNG